MAGHRIRLCPQVIRRLIILVISAAARAPQTGKGEARLNAAEGYGYYTFDLTAPLMEGTYEAALGAAQAAR